MKIKSSKKHTSPDKYKLEQDYQYEGDDYWNWSIWVESSDGGLDKIDNVIYNLHYTFRNPVQIVKNREQKFKLSASGWGTFTIYVVINFKDETVLELEHELELFYPEENISEDSEE